MHFRKLYVALKHLTAAIQEVEKVLEEMRAQKDPLAAHIFVSRRHYRNMPDTKGGKRRDISAFGKLGRVSKRQTD